MRHERLHRNRRLEAVDPNIGFLSSLTGRPTVRAVALLLTLDLSGCYTRQWAPLAPAAEPLPDRMRVRLPPSETFPREREIDLLHPWMDSDSVLVGTQSLRGHELRDSQGRPVTLRLPAGALQVAGPKEFSAGRTTLLVVGLGVGALLTLLLAFLNAMGDRVGAGPTIMW